MNDLAGQCKWPSDKARRFTESVIRGMSRVAASVGAVNLAQGFPDFPAPGFIKAEAMSAIADDINQYAITWGSKPLRDAVCGKMERTYGVSFDPESEVTVCCGSTEAMMSVMLGVVNPGDEVVILEPFYENYGPDVILCGAVPRYVTLAPPAYRLTRGDLEGVFNERTRAIIINTPNNPTGRVFTREELGLIAEFCIGYDALAITDEIYEHILYDGREHVPMCTLPGMRDRSITVNGASKTYSVTGWRIGWVLAPAVVTDAIRKVHDFLTVGAAAPLQHAVAAAMNRPGDYLGDLSSFYAERRDIMLSALGDAGFKCHVPEGAYYILADFTGLSDKTDVDFALWLAREAGVATVPGSSFFRPGVGLGDGMVRFCFCKRLDTLNEAAERLGRIRALAP